MATSESYFLVYAALTLVLKTDSSSSTTIYFGSRPVLKNSAIHPILKKVDGLGTYLDTYLPQPTTSTIVLDNSPGSLAYQRRIVDLFERYTPIEQTVIIYAIQKEIDDYNLSVSSADQVWKAKVVGWEMRGGDAPELALTIAADIVPRRVMTRIIDSETFTTAPTSSIGKYLPICIGDSVEVRAIPVSSAATTAPLYAYATTLGEDFVNDGINDIYVKDSRSNEYVEITNPASTSTAAYSSAPTVSTATTLTTFEGGCPFDVTGGSYLIRGGAVYCVGDGTYSGAVNGTLQIKLYEADEGPTSAGFGNWPRNPIATAEVTKSDYTSEIQTSANYTIEFSFDKALVVRSDKSYLLSFYDPTGTALVDVLYFRASTTDALYEYTSTYGWGILTGSSGYTLKFDLYGVKFTDQPVPGTLPYEGLGYAAVELSQKTAASGQTNPGLAEFDIILNISGLKDDSLGTLTGAANTSLNNARYAIAALETRFDGANWIAGDFDFTKFSSTHSATINGAAGNLSRLLNGKTEGRATTDQILSQLCKNSASRVTLYNGSSKQLALWAWGTTASTAREIDDEDATILSVVGRGADTVINLVSIIHDARLKEATAVDIASQGQLTGYSQNYQWTPDRNTETTLISQESADIYGDRYQVDDIFNWLNTDGEILAKYYACRYAQPDVFVSLEVPYFKYKALEMLDIVEIIHPDLPSYLGSSAVAKNPSYAGSEVDIATGTYLKRAKRYRAQIEGKEINLNPGSIPTLRLSARLLLNFPVDPT